MSNEARSSISYRAIWQMMRGSVVPFWRPAILLVFLSVAVGALNVAEPYIYGSIIDSVTASVGTGASLADGFAAIVPFLFWWVLVALSAAALVAVHAWTAWYVGNRYEQSFGERMFRKFLSLDVRRFQDERAGAMLNRFANGKEAVWNISNQAFRSILPSAVTFVIVTSAGFWVDWRLTLAALVIVPVDIAVGLFHLHLSQKHQDAMNDRWEEITGVAGDAFSNMTTVQGEAGEERVFGEFAKTFYAFMLAQLKLNWRWTIVEAGTSGVYVIGRLLIFMVGIRLVLAGTTSLGTLIMFLGFAGFIYGTVQTVMSGLPEIARGLNRLDRLARIWNEVPLVRDAEGVVSAPSFQGEVAFDRVSYAYADATKPVLRNVSFVVPAGKKLAIVGESGAGKSTLAKLLIRFADPTSGRILFDGKDIRDFALGTLRPQVGFVMQENLLFHDSILSNIRFGKPDATMEEIVAAAKRAQAHAFISKLEKGYDTVVGERGVKLSGGQKQRIALARVLLSNPPILVLDEATSALDSKTEHDLQQALREAMRNRTTIVIAHRLSTVMDADNILVMDKGRIVDQGTHAELIGRDNLYKKFWEIQAGGYV